MQANRLAAILLIGVIVVIAVYVAVNRIRPQEGIQQAHPSFTGGEDNGTKTSVGGDAGSGGRYSSVAATYRLDYNDPRVLVGYSQNIFAGKVLKEAGRVPLTPYTSHIQYNVEVLHNIKGSTPGQVVVDLEVTKGDSLTTNTTYLFTVRRSEEFGPWYYSGSHPAMRATITNNPDLTNEQLIELVLGHKRTYELLSAYPNEILDEYDVEHGYTQNSFQSLSEAGKQAIYDEIEELKALGSGTTPAEPMEPVSAPPPPDVIPPPLSPEAASANDAQRVADLRQAQIALELYFQKCGYYPGPALTEDEPCPHFFTPAPDYAAMRGVLLQSSLGVSFLPDKDPTERSYGYEASPDGKGYILAAILDDPNSDLLKNDIDGPVGSINCGSTTLPETPPTYCVRP